jgi:hypothetical protein
VLYYFCDTRSSCPGCTVATDLWPDVLDARTLAVVTQRCPGIGRAGPCDPVGCSLGGRPAMNNHPSG